MMKDKNKKPLGKIHYYPNIKTIAIEVDRFDRARADLFKKNGFYYDSELKKNKKRENFRDIPFLLSLKDFIQMESFREYLKIHHDKIEALMCHKKDSCMGISYKDTNLTPRNSQISSLRFLRANKGNCILGDEHGCGKTLPTLLYYYELNSPTLILCPKSMVETWKEEIKRIFFEGESLLESLFFVRSWDSKKEITELHGKYKSFVCDESHNLEDITSERFKFCHKIAREIGSVTLLTGKQISRWPIGFYSQLKLLGVDITKERYIRNFFETEFNNNKVVVGKFREEQLKFFVSLFYIRRTLKDVAPEVSSNTKVHRIEINPDEKKFFEKQIQARGALLSGIKVIEFNKSLSSFKVRGAVNLINEILKQDPDSKICICSQFKENFQLIKSQFKSIFNFPSNEQIIFLDTSEYREGLNLQKYSNVIFLDVYVDRTKNSQIKKRFERIGGGVVNFYFLSNGSLDHAILTMPHFSDHRLATQYLEKWITENFESSLSLDNNVMRAS